MMKTCDKINLKFLDNLQFGVFTLILSIIDNHVQSVLDTKFVYLYMPMCYGNLTTSIIGVRYFTFNYHIIMMCEIKDYNSLLKTSLFFLTEVCRRGVIDQEFNLHYENDV